MAVHSRIGEGGILVAAELVDGVVHEGVVEDPKRHQELEVLDREPRHLLEELWLQLRDNVLERLLAVVGEVHEDRDTRRELDKLLLYLFALALELLLLCGHLLLFLGGDVLLLAFGLLDGLRAVDDRLDVLVEVAEALDAHERL